MKLLCSFRDPQIRENIQLFRVTYPWMELSVDETKLNSGEMRMLRWARGKTRLDHIRNEDIRQEAHVKDVEPFLENKRLKLFDHCLRWEHN